MKRVLLPLLASVVVLGFAASNAAAQWEITPFAHYTTSASLDLTSSDPAYLGGELRAADGFGWGVAIGYVSNPKFTFEAQYQWQGSQLQFKPIGQSDIDISDMSIHQIHGNFLFTSYGRSETTQPYFLLGLGMTILDPDKFSSESRFSWALGLGVKKFVGQSGSTGVRLEAAYKPTYLTSSNDGYWCDPFYGCYVSGVAHYLDQWDFKVGLIKRFGYYQ